MRALISCLVASWMALSTAEAAPKLGVFQDRVIGNPSTPTGLTTVSRTLFVNDCMPNGCTVTVGSDNSKTNRSSIASGTNVLDAYAWGSDHWTELLDCVKTTFRPFDIDVVTTDPGSSTNHFEVMVAGTATQLNPGITDAGGIAPYIDCGATRDNGLSFVFASQSNDINYLCAAIVQEASHVWGLDHELDADDPMTYLELGTLKRFQNSSPQCGESLSDPRRCRCGGNTQNSFNYMRQTFGLSPTLGEMTLAIAKPGDGRWVAPSFPIVATMDSELSMQRGTLAIDGNVIESWTGNEILAWNAAADLAPGPHEITVTVTDAGDRTVTKKVNVKLAQACSTGCPSDFSCLEGLCVPGADQPGGLGSSCTGNDQCVTNQCTSDGTTMLCTGDCAADGTCPGGFECITAANTCWPEPSGGCTSNGKAAPTFLLMMLGALFLMRRRR